MCAPGRLSTHPATSSFPIPAMSTPICRSTAVASSIATASCSPTRAAAPAASSVCIRNRTHPMSAATFLPSNTARPDSKRPTTTSWPAATSAIPLAESVDDLLQRQPAGLDLSLTLDVDLQNRAHELLGDRIGSVVVIDVETGAVLVLASNPHFDPGRAHGARRREQRGRDRGLGRLHRRSRPAARAAGHGRSLHARLDLQDDHRRPRPSMPAWRVPTTSTRTTAISTSTATSSSRPTARTTPSIPGRCAKGLA